jgi:hypothetical protein
MTCKFKNSYCYWNGSANDVLAELEIGFFLRPPPEVCTVIGNSFVTSQSCKKWRGHFKVLSHERGWAKTAENLGASPFLELPID